MSAGNHHFQPSLYELLKGGFAGGLELHQISDRDLVILSVLDNMQRILNTRAGSLAHMPDFGLVRYDTDFMPEGRVLIRHMQQQHYLDIQTRL